MADYFESYENLDVHQTMLKDTSRNEAYKKAIFDNRRSIANKVVLDVGTGTGILSVFCAQAGAAKVYAVEASNTYKIAENVVKENGVENIVTVIHSTIEEAQLPEPVDVIVSEWMGHYLVHEGMLESVIFARDKFLKPGGLMFPESATVLAAPCRVPSMFNFWHKVDGVSMKCFGEIIRQQAQTTPLCITVKPEDLLTDPETVTWLDLREVTVEDLSKIEMSYVSVCKETSKYQGLCLWFNCNFPSIETEPVVLSTAPDEPETHWKQTVIVLPHEVDVEKEEPLAFALSIKKQDMRKYVLEFTMLDPENCEHPEYCNCYMTKCILGRAVLQNYEK